MKYLLFSLAVVLIIYFIASVMFVFFKKYELDRKIMSKDITDICKGFAILIIILSHLSNLFNIRYLTPFGAWGVSIFLFLSGYGLELSYQKNGIKGFIKKRLITAYLPFVFIEIICIIFSVNFSLASDGVLGVVKSLLLIDPIHPYGWYMQCLFLYYIAFYFSKVLFANKRWFQWVVLAITSLMILFLLRSLFKQQIFAFILGVIIANNKDKLSKYLKNIGTATLFLLCGFIIIAVRQIDAVRLLPSIIYNLFIAIESSCLMIGTIILFNLLVNNWPNIIFVSLQKIGVIAFDLYLIHAFVIQFILNKSVNYFNIILFFVISISLSLIFYLVRNTVLYVKKRSGKEVKTIN